MLISSLDSVEVPTESPNQQPGSQVLVAVALDVETNLFKHLSVNEPPNQAFSIFGKPYDATLLQ